MSMDASASAYKIMSYFTFNEKFAVATNLFRDIVHTSEELHYFYNSLLSEFKDHLLTLLDND
jgi:hypothetical protein